MLSDLASRVVEHFELVLLVLLSAVVYFVVPPTDVRSSSSENSIQSWRLCTVRDFPLLLSVPTALAACSRVFGYVLDLRGGGELSVTVRAVMVVRDCGV